MKQLYLLSLFILISISSHIFGMERDSNSGPVKICGKITLDDRGHKVKITLLPLNSHQILFNLDPKDIDITKPLIPVRITFDEENERKLEEFRKRKSVCIPDHLYLDEFVQDGNLFVNDRCNIKKNIIVKDNNETIINENSNDTLTLILECKGSYNCFTIKEELCNACTEFVKEPTLPENNQHFLEELINTNVFEYKENDKGEQILAYGQKSPTHWIQNVLNIHNKNLKKTFIIHSEESFKILKNGSLSVPVIICWKNILSDFQYLPLSTFDKVLTDEGIRTITITKYKGESAILPVTDKFVENLRKKIEEHDKQYGNQNGFIKNIMQNILAWKKSIVGSLFAGAIIFALYKYPKIGQNLWQYLSSLPHNIMNV